MIELIQLILDALDLVGLFWMMEYGDYVAIVMKEELCQYLFVSLCGKECMLSKVIEQIPSRFSCLQI